jgi:D-cysteine desulfhydrase
MAEIELFRRFPALERVPRRSLATLPTPVEPAPELVERAQIGAVWLKRDDLSAEPYGGNKVRKLEFLLADALEAGARGVWTVGAVGSNHVLATTVYAKALGLEVAARHFPQPITDHVRKNCLAVAASGAQLRFGGKLGLVGAVARRAVLAALFKPTGRLYYVPAGGSSPVGALGYVNAALELVAQVEAGDCPRPDAVFVPVGSGGTLAGLVTGFALAGAPIRVIGVRVVDRIVINRPNLDRLIRGVLRLLARHGVTAPDGPRRLDYELDHSQFGGGYGAPTPAAREAVSLAGEALELPLEQTYTGKAMAGLLANARRYLGARGTAMFVDTLNSRPVDDLIPDGFGVDQLPPAYQRFFSGGSPG